MDLILSRTATRYVCGPPFSIFSSHSIRFYSLVWLRFFASFVGDFLVRSPYSELIIGSIEDSNWISRMNGKLENGRNILKITAKFEYVFNILLLLLPPQSQSQTGRQTIQSDTYTLGIEVHTSHLSTVCPLHVTMNYVR